MYGAAATWTPPSLVDGKFASQSDLDAWKSAIANTGSTARDTGALTPEHGAGSAGGNYDPVAMANNKAAAEWGHAQGFYEYPHSNNSFGSFAQDVGKFALTNPAILAAATAGAGAYFGAPAAGAGTAAADELPGFAGANSSLASTAYSGVAPSATSLTAANLAEGGAWGAGSGVAASGWGGGEGGNESFGGGSSNPAMSDMSGGSSGGLYDVMPGAFAAAGGATGGIGGSMSAFGAGSVGNFFGGLSFRDDLALGTGLYGLYSAEEQRRLARQASRMQDPFASQRVQYQQQLAALSANPNSVTNLPGYKFGMDQGTQAIMRNQASTGYTGSGNEAIALQKFGQGYAGTYLRDEQARLAGLAGGGIQPYGSGNSLIQGNAYASETARRSLGDIVFGLSGNKWGNTTNASLFA